MSLSKTSNNNPGWKWMRGVYLAPFAPLLVWALSVGAVRSPGRPAFHHQPHREYPLRVVPQTFRRGVVGDDEAQQLKVKLIPYWKIVKINAMLHALRLWGAEATIGVDEGENPAHLTALSSPDMLQLLLDERVFEGSLVEPPIFPIRRRGDRVSVNYGTL